MAVDPTFADQAPPALGRFRSDPETLGDVERNGWSHKNWRNAQGYIERAGAYPTPLFRELKDLTQTRIRRRPCDGLSLQSSPFQKFEQENPDYFPNPYQLDAQLGFTQGLSKVLHIARQELYELDYLQPLSGIVQAVRPDYRIPFITRCWDFCRGPGALIKTAELKIAGYNRPLTGACICYEPPTQNLLGENPNNFFIFRSVVGHEIGHYWWDSLPADTVPEELAFVLEITDEATRNQVIEQVVSLFSIFVIMYRGYWARRKLTEAELEAAWDKLKFETRAAARQEKEILKELKARKTLPVFEPQAADADLGILQKQAQHQLPSDAVSAIRWAAKDLVKKASCLPFTSVASIIGQRKLDTFVTFKQTASDEYPSWSAIARQAEHLNSARRNGRPGKPDAMSMWNEVQLTVPDPGDNALPLGHRLQVARHLAHIRLHLARATSSSRSDLRRAADVERVCSAESRDLARVLALATYSMHGETQRRPLSMSLAKLLLERDPAGLGYLSPYAETDFQWCCDDPDCPTPEFEDRFLAEIYEIGNNGEAHCTFWGEEGYELRISLALEHLRNNGFEDSDLYPGMQLKLFGVRTEEGRQLLPVPLRVEDENKDTPDQPGASTSGRQESRVRATEPLTA